MTEESAETAVVTSALVMSGIYLYRRLVEPIGEKEKAKRPNAQKIVEGVVGRGELLPTGSWVVGMGVSYITISILASISPNIGGYSAILLATTTFLASGYDFFGDLQESSKSSLAKQEEKKKSEKTETTGPPQQAKPILS